MILLIFELNMQLNLKCEHNHGEIPLLVDHTLYLPIITERPIYRATQHFLFLPCTVSNQLKGQWWRVQIVGCVFVCLQERVWCTRPEQLGWLSACRILLGWLVDMKDSRRMSVDFLLLNVCILFFSMKGLKMHSTKQRLNKFNIN